MTIVVTGGAGFIGSNFIRDWLEHNDEAVVNLDKLTYAGNLQNLASLVEDHRHTFIQGDIADSGMVKQILSTHSPRAVINFAAESHVDRSIQDPERFIQTNIVATFKLLETVRGFWTNLVADRKDGFRFLQVSTDEVFGSLGLEGSAFKEQSPYQPNNPYSASKAAGDHLVRAYHHTYGLPVLTTTSSNNYGPNQYPEKLVPLMIHNALADKSLPLYGDGQQIRDWLYVRDHCTAIQRILQDGAIGEIYNIGGRNERTNLDVVYRLCDLLDELKPRSDGRSYRNQISFISDRPGHDKRYAIDSSRLRNSLGWQPGQTFDSGMRNTVQWYLDNQAWVAGAISEDYLSWVKDHYH